MGNQRDAHAFPLSRHIHHRGYFHAVGAFVLSMAQCICPHPRLLSLHAFPAIREALVDAQA